MFSEQRITKTESIKYVQSGKIATGSKDEVMISSPLGSCVAVVAYDAKSKIGGIAHIMLPGKSPKKNSHNKNRYTKDAIDTLLSELHELGTKNTNIEICLIGGANVLRTKNDIIAITVINSVLETLKKNKLTIRASSLGGFERRSVMLNLKTGIVYYTIGESIEKVLWKFQKK